MKDSFTIRQDLSFKEYLRSNLYFFFVSRRLRFYGLVLTAVSAYGSGSVTASKKIDLTAIVSVFVPILLMAAVLALGIYFVSLYLYRAKPYLFKEVSYEFTHWGIVRHGERTQFSKQWREITKVRESKNFFLFYAGMDAHTIPKRVFSSPGELDAFRQFLKRAVDAKILK